jgi:hypothetical protein
MSDVVFMMNTHVFSTPFRRIVFGLLVLPGLLMNACLAKPYVDVESKVFNGSGYTLGNTVTAQAVDPERPVTPYSSQYGPTNPGTPAKTYGSNGGYTPSSTSVNQVAASSGLSPVAKVLTGTAAGTLGGAVVGTLTGLTLGGRSSTRRVTTTTFHPVNIGSECAPHFVDVASTETRIVRNNRFSRGSGAARGLAWGAAYGAGVGLLGGLAYAYFTRDPIAVSSSTYP